MCCGTTVIFMLYYHECSTRASGWVASIHIYLDCKVSRKKEVIYMKTSFCKYRFGTMLYYHTKESKEKCVYLRHDLGDGVAVIVFENSNAVMKVPYEHLERCFR